MVGYSVMAWFLIHSISPNKYPAIVASRTIEANTATPFTSLQTTLKFTTDNPYITPYVDEENLDIFLETFQINAR